MGTIHSESMFVTFLAVSEVPTAGFVIVVEYSWSLRPPMGGGVVNHRANQSSLFALSDCHQRTWQTPEKGMSWQSTVRLWECLAKKKEHIRIFFIPKARYMLGKHSFTTTSLLISCVSETTRNSSLYKGSLPVALRFAVTQWWNTWRIWKTIALVHQGLISLTFLLFTIYFKMYF